MTMDSVMNATASLSLNMKHLDCSVDRYIHRVRVPCHHSTLPPARFGRELSRNPIIDW